MVYCIVLVWPLPKYTPTYSTILYDTNQNILSFSISSEQQWHFPLIEDIPENLKKCITIYEDEYINFHPGINPISLLKAAIINTNQNKIISGGSTLAMQVMRMKSRHSKRNYYNKFLEMVAALKFSLLNKDDEIIKAWCEIAPFGGNTIGIQSAAMRYFGRSLDNMSWSEYALLTVMPNGPSHANLTKNRIQLKTKRDNLLKKLARKGIITKDELMLAQDEELPKYIHVLPQRSYQALTFLKHQFKKQNVLFSTIDLSLQMQLDRIIQEESDVLQNEGVRNAAILVVDIVSNEVKVYIGNTKSIQNGYSYVDIVQAPRSYGSLLKPFLYGFALETNTFLPKELVDDLPIQIGEFRPQNFDKKHRGAIPMDEMVIQSLNVPAVNILQKIGLQNFYRLIEDLKIQHLDKGFHHYGLSIILGGGESSLWEMVRLYKGLARNYIGLENPFDDMKILQDQQINTHITSWKYSPYAIKHIVRTMTDVVRPREEKILYQFANQQKIAWKTGTSFGHRDAWAVGFNARYAVGVWVGNENGEGRYNLTGISKAAPLLFKIFNALPDNKWFANEPYLSPKNKIAVCAQSGKMKSPLCNHAYSLLTSKISHNLNTCAHHEIIALDATDRIIDVNCNIPHYRYDTIFILPPNIEYYYKKSNINYQGKSSYTNACNNSFGQCKIIYPYNRANIFLPKENANNKKTLIINGYHQDNAEKIFWFVNDRYYTFTMHQHDFQIALSKGKHTITMMDTKGNSDQVVFTILDSK